jgi:hypothetical protein
MSWLRRAAWAGAVLTCGGFALVGVGAAGAVAALATGYLSAEDVSVFAGRVRDAGSYLAGIGGTGVAGVLARFGVPAALAALREHLTTAVKSTVQEMLGGK